MLLGVLLYLISGALAKNEGPVFLLEPPTHLTFSNTTGSQVSCSAHGSPIPQVDWVLQDGHVVTSVPGLRQSLGNGTLYFPPFKAEDYRKDVHSTLYRCRARNSIGTIISRDVNVNGVVNQHYDVQVNNVHVTSGNTAVLACFVSSHVKDYVTVTSWSRDDSILLPGANVGGRIIVIYGSGELHIRSARPEDGAAKYSCLTIHSLTQERRKSDPATLTVTDSTQNMSPRLAPNIQPLLFADRESDIHLTCSAQGNPPPTFTWYREKEGHLQPVLPSPRFEISQDILYIRRLNADDAGRWTCKASNIFGEQRLDMHINVTAHLSVYVIPQIQVADTGNRALFNCTVSGSPIGSIQWFRNGEPLLTDDNGKFKLFNEVVLAILGVTRHDRGMYQCVVRNSRETAQGSAELKLGDTAPELQHTFIEQALKPGPQVSLRCSATGSPPPQFTWLLDGEPISITGHRQSISQYVNQVGDVIAHLNITSVRVEDGGFYTCRATNALGSTDHSTRLNVYGAPSVRSIGPVESIAGTKTILHCPYSGYPITSVRWERHGQKLPLDLRHSIDTGGSLTIAKVDPHADAGFYVCMVTGSAPANGRIARKEVELVVRSPPTLEPFVFPANLQEGGRAQVTCYATSGDTPLHFNWYKDSRPIPSHLKIDEQTSDQFSMLIFKEVYSKHSGAYTCVASNSAAQVNYTAQLMVKVAPQWVIEPHNISVLLGNPILMECAARGFPEPQISWLKGQGKTSVDYQPLLSLHSRSLVLSNGSVWMAAAGPQDEGYYLCRAANGIGAGLAKAIYAEVNEPARFDLPSRNMSIKRGHPATLMCLVYGDVPIDIKWTLNSNRIDSNNGRYAINNINTENGIRSQLMIGDSERDDSGTYKCLAENAFGRSQHIISLTVQERPDPPTALQVIEVTGRSVRLSWRKPFDGNSPVIGYLLQYQIRADLQNWSSAILNLTLPASAASSDEVVQSTNVAGLAPDTVYTMRMLAINSIDQSAFTESVVARTQEEEPSAPPLDVKVESVKPTELTVTWNTPPKNTWNGKLLGYVINWNEHGTAIHSGITGSIANVTRSHTVKGWGTKKVVLSNLKKFTRYDVNVRAFNSVSIGPPSITVIGTTMEGVPEASPQNLMCSQTTAQSMKISWTPPPAGFHNGHILGYKIFYKPIPNYQDVDIPIIEEVKRTSSIDTYLHGLYKWTNYTIKGAAYTAAGDGIVSDPLVCNTEEDLPGSPAAIKAAALTGESIIVSWLPPTRPNGRITHYMVYGREAGRVGKHTSHTVRTDADRYEVRNLAEHQMYEFWVAAMTSVGEGASTAIVAETVKSRIPSRIISFSQMLRKPDGAHVLLTCTAVGNPKPRTIWTHAGRPITFDSSYQITDEGHLEIGSVSQSQAGNYTCSAKNLFGEDQITYILSISLPPSEPFLEIQFATMNSIRVRWTKPNDGGTPIQGYILTAECDPSDSRTYELSADHTVYTLEDLRCGSVYHLSLYAYNRAGRGRARPALRTTTKGGPPLLPASVAEFITTNASAMQVSLHHWPDGGCPIKQFAIKYRAASAVRTTIGTMADSQHQHHHHRWTLISDTIDSKEKVVVQDLEPATWYTVRIMAENAAGKVVGTFRSATTIMGGAETPAPPAFFDDEYQTISNWHTSTFMGILITIGVLMIVLSLLILWYIISKRREGVKYRSNNAEPSPAEHENNKCLDNTRNCQQGFISALAKLPPVDKIPHDDESETYEITPYATFTVPEKNARSVNTTALDAMLFKTFGHIEEDDLIMYPQHLKKNVVCHKHRYCNSEGGHLKSRVRSSRTLSGVRNESESEDTSGSGSGGAVGVVGGGGGVGDRSYRLQSSSGKCSNSREMMTTSRYSCNETLPLSFSTVAPPAAGGSSSDSNEASPERRHTPRHLVPRTHNRPSSSSSVEGDVAGAGYEYMLSSRINPPIDFSDSKELNQFEESAVPDPLSNQIATLLTRYQDRKKMLRKGFSIQV